MNCPHCGAVVPDGALYCPSCRYEVGATQRIPKATGVWCPSCGALMPEGAEVCDKCGRPLHEHVAPRAKRSINLPEIEVEEKPRQKVSIGSALPPEEGFDSGLRSPDRLPRPRFLLFAAFMALLVVGGAVVLITHPWNPRINDIRATEDADLSMVGFPGERETLTGQDSTRRDVATTSTYDTLLDLYGRLGELSERADACEGVFFDIAITGTSEERAEAAEEVRALAIELSNTIAEIGQVSGANGAYADDISNLVALGNWLRNRVDALSRAWEIDLSYADPAAVEDTVKAPVTSSEYVNWGALFEQNYDAWAPVNRE